MVKKRARGKEGAAGAEAERTEELQLAQRLEAEVQAGLASVADLTFPLSSGNLKEFPRPSPENRAAEAGLAYLRESAEGAVAALYLIAAAREQGVDVPAVLRAAVEPYLAALGTEPE